MSAPTNSSPLPALEDTPDNTVGWLLANAGLFVVAAPFVTAYWAAQGYKGLRKELRAMRPSSGPFRDYRRIAFELERQSKTGIPANTDVYLPMRLDRQAPQQGPVRPAETSGMAVPATVGGQYERRNAAPSQFARSLAPRPAGDVLLPRVLDRRLDLRVPFEAREKAKSFGVRWDAEGKTWYAPAGVDLVNVKDWLPFGVKIDVPETEAAPAPAPGVVPAQIAAARAAQQTAMRVQDNSLVMEALAAAAEEEEELPPVEAYSEEVGVV